jgi:hypothetical protein
MLDSMRRRSFLKRAAAAGLLATQVPAALAVAASTDGSDSGGAVTDFARSFLYCSPNKSGIWVRIQMECHCRLIDKASGKTDEFALGVVAKTGLTKDPKSGGITPGYDYWLIFGKDKLYTRRTHATVYCANPTTLTEADFGKFGWRLQPAPATPLREAADVKQAVESYKRLVARTEFPSADGARSYVIDYPVKWVDCGVERKTYRVETGPLVLLDPDHVKVGQPPALEDFRWAHVDFHDADQVRLLLDRPTPILSEAAFFPPTEDKREVRPNPPMTAEQVKIIEDRLFGDWAAPIPQAAMRELFSTDHYSDMAEKKVTNSLFAID